jgi:hypothetical protein
LLQITTAGALVRRIWERSMLISFWWVVVAFILGGTGGLLGLAIFSAMADLEEREAANFNGISPTR